MFARKKLSDYTSLLSPDDFKNNDHMILSYLENEWMPFCWNNWQNKVTNQTKFRLDEISKISNYLIEQINQRNSCSKKLSKYVAVFDYIDQALTVLSATSGRVSIISFTSIDVAPVEIASVSLPSFFSLTTEIVKALLNITRNRKKKHDRILMLAKSKLNSIETLISQALFDMEICHEEFIIILKEKDNDEKMKDNLRSENAKYQIIRLSSVKSKT